MSQQYGQMYTSGADQSQQYGQMYTSGADHFTGILPPCEMQQLSSARSRDIPKSATCRVMVVACIRLHSTNPSTHIINYCVTQEIETFSRTEWAKDHCSLRHSFALKDSPHIAVYLASLMSVNKLCNYISTGAAQNLYLAHIIVRDQDVPRSQVSVDKGLLGEVLHSRGNLPTVAQQYMRQTLIHSHSTSEKAAHR